MSVDSLTNTAYGVTLEGEGLTSEMELVITQLKAGNADVERMRKKISSSKALYRVFDVKLLLDGEEIELPGEATLYIPVNEKYNGQTLQVLHCHDSKEVTSLKGKAANGILPVEIDSLSSFGVVVNQKDLPGSSAEEKETTKLTSGVQTGDTAPVGILLLLVLAAGAGIVWVLYKKRKERQ